MGRLGRGEALRHPRRRLLLEFVRGDPGANFREIARRTRLDLGTVRHHLTVLVRSGWVVERAHGATVRFFDARAAHDGDWVEVVLRREPALAALHDWLKLNSGVPQSRGLEAMAARGWPRSSTQHRLARLAEAGLAQVVPQGRFLLHSAASPGAEPGDLAAGSDWEAGSSLPAARSGSPPSGAAFLSTPVPPHRKVGGTDLRLPGVERCSLAPMRSAPFPEPGP